VTISFFGVRGSTPCDGPEIARYGGNTSCVGVDVPGHGPIMFDVGTGARYYGLKSRYDAPFDGHCLLTHLHWDHVQGLPFFPPILKPGAKLAIHAPAQADDGDLATIFREIWRPPSFPIGIDGLPAELSFHAHADDEFAIGEVQVTTRLVPHVGPTLGYRLDWRGQTVAYLSDHQQPGIDVYEVAPGARDLVSGVDVLIHDAQYTRPEFEMKSTWGHCTIEYAAWVAEAHGVRTLVLFHHDPAHDDDFLDELREIAAAAAPSVRVVSAREGESLVVGC
jgi:phosphoribosyl 1,2-cyclic phosphodiesterase